MRPIVGIISNHYLINDQYPAHANGSMNTDAVSKVAGAMPLTFPGDPSVVGIDENTVRPRPRRMAPSTATATAWPCR